MCVRPRLFWAPIHEAHVLLAFAPLLCAFQFATFNVVEFLSMFIGYSNIHIVLGLFACVVPAAPHLLLCLMLFTHFDLPI
jgi:hypothetical protein